MRMHCGESRQFGSGSRVANESDLVDLEVIEHGDDVLYESVEVVTGQRMAGSSVPATRQAENTEPIGELVSEVIKYVSSIPPTG
jgi:hypothetical protein